MKRHLRKCSAAFILAAAFLLSLWLPGTAAAVRAEVTAPEKPAAVGSARANYITIKWDKVPGATGYELFKLNSDRKFHWFKSISGNTTKLKIRGKYNLTYYYRMRSYTRVNGKKIYSRFCSVKVKTAPSPSTVITSTSRDKSDSGVVTWKKNSYADGYEIYRSVAANGDYQKIATIESSSVHAVRDTRLVTNRTYYYKVRAYSKNVDSVAYGSFGKSKSLKKYSDEESPAMTGTGRKLLVVGDSRVLFMSTWCRNSGVSYIAKSNIGIDWLSSAEIQSQILSALDGNTDICVWIGTNDYDYYNRYAAFYKMAVPQWKAKGARVYLAGLGQFLGGKDGYGSTDSDLVRFNTYLKKTALSLGSGVKYLNLYSYLAKKGVSYLSGDRVHYSEATTSLIYRYFLAAVK